LGGRAANISAIVLMVSAAAWYDPPAQSQPRGETVPIFPIAVILIVVVIVAIIYGHYAAKKRREALRAWAQSRSLRFDQTRDHSVEDIFPQFNCLHEGSNRYAENRMFGHYSGREFLGFDYHYETHSTDSKGRRQTHHHHFSAVILGSKVPLKPLFIRPEGFFDKVKEFFGFDDIDFESAEFSRKFYVKARDRRWAYDVIHQRTMEFLLGSPEFTIEFGAGRVIAYRSGRFGATEFEQAAEVICGILDRLPDYLVRQQTAAQPEGR